MCTTYQVRSRFVITSLRPAFAKIYPSTRPDLAVETFFHAKAGSPLLRGITDDDFITWFDKTELASLKTFTNVDNICECGRICRRIGEEEGSSTEATTENTPTLSSLKTEKISIATQSPTSIKTSTEPEVTSTDSEVLTTTSSTENILTIQSDLNVENKTVSTKIHDDPIIIPTATYVNNSLKDIKLENSIAPVITNGELIVQKLGQNKFITTKQNEIRKKPLPRRKGTLKATYGDKQDKFFQNIPVSSTTSTTDLDVTTLINTYIPKPNIITKNIPSKDKIINNTDVSISTLITPNLTQLNKNVITNNTTKKPHKDELKNKTLPHVSKDSTFPPHIATVTKSNIKSIFYKTKNSKTFQINKTLPQKTIHNFINATIPINTFEIKINNTKSRNITKDKYFIKPFKSINKEIHKVPAIPISETSKHLDNSPKVENAPENRDGFEILDKNNLWDLLKEGSEAETSNIDNKLSIHTRIKVDAHNASSIINNRSL